MQKGDAVVDVEANAVHGPAQTAEAVAESDVTAMRLPIDAFDRLMQEHPVLAAKLLTNIALHLGERVRVLTGDFSRWVIRSAAGRAE